MDVVRSGEMIRRNALAGEEKSRVARKYTALFSFLYELGKAWSVVRYSSVGYPP
jgi:hypothetical protein